MIARNSPLIPAQAGIQRRVPASSRGRAGLGFAVALGIVRGYGVRAGEGTRRQFLQLVGLYRADSARRFHQGDRHQGALRHLRFQRHAGGEAARRQIRLRRRGADRLFSRAPDRGRHFSQARQGEVAQSGQCLAGNLRSLGALRSRQSIRRQLHVGDHRHRLQRESRAPICRRPNRWRRCPRRRVAR